LWRSTRVITALLPSLPTTSRVAGTRYCVPAPSEPCKQLFTAHGSSKSQRLTGRQKYCIRRCGGAIPPLTVGVEGGECVITRNAPSCKRDLWLCCRLPGDQPPRFPMLPDL